MSRELSADVGETVEASRELSADAGETVEASRELSADVGETVEASRELSADAGETVEASRELSADAGERAAPGARGRLLLNNLLFVWGVSWYAWSENFAAGAVEDVDTERTWASKLL